MEDLINTKEKQENTEKQKNIRKKKKTRMITFDDEKLKRVEIDVLQFKNSELPSLNLPSNEDIIPGSYEGCYIFYYVIINYIILFTIFILLKQNRWNKSMGMFTRFM